MSDPLYTTFAKTSDGDIEIPIRLLRGRDAVAQRLTSRFKFFKGEWFLDKRLGVPYYRVVLKKNPNMRLVRSLYRQVILRCPGVQSILSFSLDLDRIARELTIEFEARLSDGSIFRSQPEEFIISALG